MASLMVEGACPSAALMLSSALPLLAGVADHAF
jgi:hypothetical protein